MNPLQPFLENQPFLLLDGALATELERRGATLDDPLWSAKILIEAPELIREVHLAYFKAGADVATTASYQATIRGFQKRGLTEPEAAEMLRRSVHLACEARDEFWSKKENRTDRLRPLVAASIGCYGAFLADGSEYRGNYDMSQKALENFHRQRLQILADTEADLLAFETIPNLDEAKALVNLLSEIPGKAAWLSFSCLDEQSICNGDPFEEAASLANESDQILAVGVNCTNPAFVEALLKKAAAVTSKPLVAYPNSGEKWDATHHCWLPTDDQFDLPNLAKKWLAASAKLIGGCCRTSPEDIRQLARLKNSFLLV